MFRPRQLQSKTKPKPPLTAEKAATVAPPPFVSDLNQPSTSSSNGHSNEATEPSTSTAPSADQSTSNATPSKKEKKLSALEQERLETLLTTIESSFSDWELSAFQHQNGILRRLKQNPHQNVHLQHVIRIPPIAALATHQADLQKALRLRPSPLVELCPTDPFQLHRIPPIDYARLESLSPQDWDDCLLYVVRKHPAPSVHSLSLSSILSTLLRTQIQRIVLPRLYDPSNPPAERLASSLDSSDQSIAFQASRNIETKTKGRKGLQLPKSGGAFKGFAFVMVGTKEEANRAINEWGWEKWEQAQGKDGEEEIEEEGIEKAASKGGMRVIAYSRWLEFKIEYLEYQRGLAGLKKQASQQNHPPRSRSTLSTTHARPPIPERPGQSMSMAMARDLPPHQNPTSSPSSMTTTTTKRPSNASIVDSRPSKKPRPSLEGSTTVEKPLPPLDSRAALKVKGAYPVGCVLWVRNVHEKSTKGSLRLIFARLLDRLEEGSGRGAEYVEYEKGLETCHVRFSTPHHASLVLDHFNTNPTVHRAPTYFSFQDDPESPPEEIEIDSDPNRRTIVAELLKGEKEREYWAAIPEEKRRDARKSVQGPVGVVGAKHGGGAEEEVGGGGGGEGVEKNEVEEQQSTVERKRKRPSARF